MKITVNYPCPEYTSYRTARVKSLFNVENAAFHKEVNLPIEGRDWKIGVVVGASGSGKSSVGRLLWPDTKPYQPSYVHISTYPMVNNSALTLPKSSVKLPTAW